MDNTHIIQTYAIPRIPLSLVPYSDPEISCATAVFCAETFGHLNL